MYSKNKKSNGNRVAECYTRYGSTLLKIIEKKIQNPHIAEEILHDLFLKLHRNGLEIDPYGERTKGYLITAAKNLVKDYFRSTEFENVNVLNVNFETLDPDLYPTPSLEDIYIEGEVISTLCDTIEKLHPDERAIYLRYHILKHHIKDITTDFGISEFQMRKILRRISSLLKENLHEYNTD